MIELLALAGSERYGACDDEACQGGRNAGEWKRPGRNDLQVKRQKRRCRYGTKCYAPAADVYNEQL